MTTLNDYNKNYYILYGSKVVSSIEYRFSVREDKFSVCEALYDIDYIYVTPYLYVNAQLSWESLVSWETQLGDIFYVPCVTDLHDTFFFLRIFEVFSIFLRFFLNNYDICSLGVAAIDLAQKCCMTDQQGLILFFFEVLNFEVFEFLNVFYKHFSPSLTLYIVLLIYKTHSVIFFRILDFFFKFYQLFRPLFQFL